MRMYMRLLLGSVGRTLRSRNDLLMENLVLRQQLAAWGGKMPSDQSRRRNLHSLTVTDRILQPRVVRHQVLGGLQSEYEWAA